MPSKKIPLLVATRYFFDKIKHIKKKKQSSASLGYQVQKGLLRLLDDHIYDPQGKPRYVKDDMMIVREPVTGLQQLNVVTISNSSISPILVRACIFNIHRPINPSANYAIFPKTSHGSVKISSSECFHLNLRPEIVFENGVIGHRTSDIGEQVLNNVPIKGVQFPMHGGEFVSLPYLQWVQTDCSKALNVLMNPQSSFSSLPNELKHYIFKFCI